MRKARERPRDPPQHLPLPPIRFVLNLELPKPWGIAALQYPEHLPGAQDGRRPRPSLRVSRPGAGEVEVVPGEASQRERAEAVWREGGVQWVVRVGVGHGQLLEGGPWTRLLGGPTPDERAPDAL